MTEQEQQLVNKLRKVAVCVYIAAEESVAKDISTTCIDAAKTLETLDERCTALRAEADIAGQEIMRLRATLRAIDPGPR